MCACVAQWQKKAKKNNTKVWICLTDFCIYIYIYINTKKKKKREASEKACERYQGLSEEEKNKATTELRMIKKSLKRWKTKLSIEKNIKCGKKMLQAYGLLNYSIAVLGKRLEWSSLTFLLEYKKVVFCISMRNSAFCCFV